MSNTPRGEGWWRASDGKFYPPESHPQFVTYQQPSTQPSVKPLAWIGGVALIVVVLIIAGIWTMSASPADVANGEVPVKNPVVEVPIRFKPLSDEAVEAAGASCTFVRTYGQFNDLALKIALKNPLGEIQDIKVNYLLRHSPSGDRVHGEEFSSWEHVVEFAGIDKEIQDFALPDDWFMHLPDTKQPTVNCWP